MVVRCGSRFGIFLVFLLVVVVACGSPAEPSDLGQAHGQSGDGFGSAAGSGEPADPEGAGSPIRIPLPIDGSAYSGLLFADAKRNIERDIKFECGNNELCIQVVKVADRNDANDEGPDCDRVSDVVGAASDEKGNYVNATRGGEIAVAVNVPCEELEPPASSPSSNSSGESNSGGGGSQHDGTGGDAGTNDPSGT